MSNGRIISTVEFKIKLTKIRPQEQISPTCIFNGTLSISITRHMMSYSTLLVYTFQRTFAFNIAEFSC